MILNNSDWFLLGAFTILSLYFIAYFLTKKSEKYNLYFALGCILSIIRIISYKYINSIDDSSDYYHIIKIIVHLTFIWLPFLYVVLADSLFPKISHKLSVQILLIIVVVLSLFTIFVSEQVFPYYISYDYIILFCMIYVTYIFTVALIKRKPFATSLFIANLFVLSAVVHDVLRGSYIISTPFGELYPYIFLVYLYTSSIVSFKKHLIIEKKHFESQINFLHAQIQPHFLYNTLGTINAFCKIDSKKSQEILNHLSTYLRGKLKNDTDMFTSLKDELNLIKSYLAIEQIRFEERLKVEYDIDEDCNVLIPCLIIQPIVENAVKHGLIPKEEGGTLKISVKKEETNVVIKIEDNGIGISTDRLSDILEGKESGIGLSNTNERLKMYYNTDIKVKSEAGKGSEFTITIPVKKGIT